jgi:hypothetical protein
MRRTRTHTGISLAKGPAALVGIALIAYGVLAFIFGATGFGLDAPDGTVNGDTFLGIEANGWTAALFAAAGLLLLLGAPAHWGAKTMSLIVAAALGAAAVIAHYDGSDVFGIFAANRGTTIAWGATAVALLLIAFLPRVGRYRDRDYADRRYATTAEGEVPRRRTGRFSRDADRDVVVERDRERV